MERYEYYKSHGTTYRVSTCACCRDDGYQDALRSRWGKRVRCAIRVDALIRTRYMTLITEAEARKRAPSLFAEGLYAL